MLRTINRTTRGVPSPSTRLLPTQRRWLSTQWPKCERRREGKENEEASSMASPSPLSQAEVDSSSKLESQSQSEEGARDTSTSTSTTSAPASASTSSLPLDIERVRERIRRWSVQKASRMRVRMDEFSATAQLAFQRLGGRVNEVTGYSEIENLKKLVGENERRMNAIREEAKRAKLAYEEAVARRSNSQRETNELLQRKSSWNDADVLRFTQLVRADHAHEQEEALAKARVEEIDAAVERQFSELMRSILSRYHEEQIWSDKIRSASTYGSLAALGLNLVVFILAIVLVEPWKRKRLVQSFERRVIELNEANQRVVEEGLKDLKVHQEEQQGVLAEIRAAQAALREDTAQVELSEMDDSLGEEVGSKEAFERNAKSSRDRQIIVISAASALCAGIAGYVLGTLFN